MFELVNTSLPNGLLPGTHGFATVAMTRGLADNLRRRLEDLSAYVHKTSAHDATYETLNPVAWSHLILPRGEHVLGRVAAAPFDYTGRTNRLARLVCLSAAETKAINAAETLLRKNSYFSAPWEGEARWLEPDAALATRFGAPFSRASRKAQAWIDAFGETDGSRYAASFAALLRDAIHKNGKPLVFVTSQQSDPDGRLALTFIADLIALLPEDLQPSATFSTYPCAIPIGVKCAIRVLRKDDNGYAQAVAGVPVADFAEKAVQNATLLPHDTELEHLAATGNLPAPTATVEISPQSAAAQPSVTIKAAADEAIDVSIDIPPATESDETIAVTEKDASHRKPRLKQRSVQSSPLSGQGRGSISIFEKPRKRSNGPLIAAIAGAAVLFLCLGAFIVLKSRPNGSISGSDTSVQTAQDAERARIKEQFERERTEALRSETEEKQRREAEATAAKEKAEQAERDRLAREKAAKAANQTVSETAQSGKAKPLYPNIREILFFANDDEAKAEFGYPTKNGLSAGSVWYYDGSLLKACSFTASDSGKDRYWFTLDSDNNKYELVGPKGLPKDTRYCRIWYFENKADTLFCVTNRNDFTSFTIPAPHCNSPTNLADRFFGPDRSIHAQFAAVKGRVSCLAWSAEGTNHVEWISVDAETFVPSTFIAQCRELRLSALKAALTAATDENSKVEAGYAAALKAKEDELDRLKKKLQAVVQEAESAFTDAEKEYKEATDELTKAEAELKKANDAVQKAQNEVESAKADKAVKGKQGRINAAKIKLEQAKEQFRAARRERNSALSKVDDVKPKFESAQRRREKVKSVKNPREAALEGEIERIKKAPAAAQAKVSAIETEIRDFPTVAAAQKQWTIHVKVDLGEGK